MVSKEGGREILRTFGEAERKSKPHWKNLFTDVYKEIPDHIRYTDIIYNYKYSK